MQVLALDASNRQLATQAQTELENLVMSIGINFNALSLDELKAQALELNAKVEGDRRCRETWIRACKLAVQAKEQLAKKALEIADKIAESEMLPKAVEIATNVYECAEAWRKEGAEVDMWVVAGHYLGTFYSDYRKGLRYMQLIRQFLIAVIDGFVESCEEQSQINQAIAVAMYSANELVLHGSTEGSTIVVYPHQAIEATVKTWVKPGLAWVERQARHQAQRRTEQLQIWVQQKAWEAETEVRSILSLVQWIESLK